MKVFWTPLAVERVDGIYDFISNDNVSAAHNVVEKIFRKVESLIENPERGRKVPELKRENIRELFEGEYRIIYRIDNKRIFILTIRNFKQLLSETDIE